MRYMERLERVEVYEGFDLLSLVLKMEEGGYRLRNCCWVRCFILGFRV